METPSGSYTSSWPHSSTAACSWDGVLQRKCTACPYTWLSGSHPPPYSRTTQPGLSASHVLPRPFLSPTSCSQPICSLHPLSFSFSISSNLGNHCYPIMLSSPPLVSRASVCVCPYVCGVWVSLCVCVYAYACVWVGRCMRMC